jgi:hypothetical protein
VDANVFVLGMHRSGTSAVTRLISLLGLHTPPDEDLVQPSAKNPTGYWESESLVAFNERLLWAVDCDISCPIVLAPGWEHDARLDRLRADAPSAVRAVFPSEPWVWKDPRHCLAFAFWRSALAIDPVVVLVNRNPLEITASALRVRGEQGKIYALALWERYLRQGLAQITGLPVLVADYPDVLSAPLAWCTQAHAFLEDAGVPAHAHRDADVLEFIDTELRHTEFTRDTFLADADVSEAQRRLFLVLEELKGAHQRFATPDLPDETPTTEALLTERRRALELRRELDSERQSRWGSRLRSSKYTAPARPLYTGGRRLLKALDRRELRDPREPLHVLHVGKTGGTALNHVLVEHAATSRYRPVFGGHQLTIADIPPGERFMFFIRDPLSRFVSSFNSRLREGRPRYHYPWREEERAAFAIFKTPDQLAAALSSDDPEERAQAEHAMRGIGHVNTRYSYWFGDEAAFRARVPDLFFVGFQESLDEDFESLKRKLGLPPRAELPRGVEAAHMTPPGFDTQLGETARANLERWYADDAAFVELCRELAPRVNVTP